MENCTWTLRICPNTGEIVEDSSDCPCKKFADGKIECSAWWAGQYNRTDHKDLCESCIFEDFGNCLAKSPNTCPIYTRNHIIIVACDKYKEDIYRYRK